jgi:hypothetical protein
VVEQRPRTEQPSETLFESQQHVGFDRSRGLTAARATPPASTAVAARTSRWRCGTPASASSPRYDAR